MIVITITEEKRKGVKFTHSKANPEIFPQHQRSRNSIASQRTTQVSRNIYSMF